MVPGLGAGRRLLPVQEAENAQKCAEMPSQDAENARGQAEKAQRDAEQAPAASRDG